jgi:hypothetical protein
MDWWVGLGWWAVGIFVAANVPAYLADLEYVRLFGVFRTGDLKRVSENVVVVQVCIWSYNDAIAQ